MWATIGGETRQEIIAKLQAKNEEKYTEAMVVGLKKGMEILKMLRGHVDMTL